MLFSNESNFILFIPRSMLSAFKIATNLCQNALALLMPVFILRVPLIFSVFAFWIWLGINSLSCPLPFRILTPKHWGPLAYLDAPNFYNFDAIVIDERWPDDSCPDDLILTKRKLRWPTNRKCRSLEFTRPLQFCFSSKICSTNQRRELKNTSMWLATCSRQSCSKNSLHARSARYTRKTYLKAYYQRCRLLVMDFWEGLKICRAKLSNQPHNIEDEHGNFVVSFLQHHRHCQIHYMNYQRKSISLFPSV